MKYKKSHILKSFLLLLILCCLFTDAFAFKIRFTWYKNNKYVYLSDVAKYYGMKLRTNKMYCKLSSRYTNIKFHYKSKEMYINGHKILLSMPAIYNKGNPAICEKDFLLLLDPIVRKETLKRHKLTTVIIDPGHGGKDNGAAGKYYKEKDIVYSIALKLKSILKSNGFKVVLTRDKYSFIPLKSRPAVSVKYDGDIFISIHCNSVGGNLSRVKGVETFIYTPIGTSSTNGGSPVSKKQYGNIHDKNNARLGHEIQKNIINSKKYKITDRGLKHSRFAVLKYSSVPSVLVETGFISNPAEERLLGSSRYQNEIALSIARGIISYRNAMLAGKD